MATDPPGLVRAEHGRRLLDYLQRARSVRAPGRDLLYLQNTGSVFGPACELAEMTAQSSESQQPTSRHQRCSCTRTPAPTRVSAQMRRWKPLPCAGQNLRLAPHRDPPRRLAPGRRPKTGGQEATHYRPSARQFPCPSLVGIMAAPRCRPRPRSRRRAGPRPGLPSPALG